MSLRTPDLVPWWEGAAEMEWHRIGAVTVSKEPKAVRPRARRPKGASPMPARRNAPGSRVPDALSPVRASQPRLQGANHGWAPPGPGPGIPGSMPSAIMWKIW